MGGSLKELSEFAENSQSSTKGKFIGCRCDHRVDSDIKNVLQRIEKNHGRLDVLVNNAFQVPSNENDSDLLFRNFWEQKEDFWDTVINVGLRSHYVTSCYAIPLMNKTASIEYQTSLQQISLKQHNHNPVIFHISSFGGVSYSFNVAYGVGKAGVDRLAKDMAKELSTSMTNISCVSLYPGVVRTERMVEIIDSGEWMKKTGLYTPPEFIESPLLTGRVIAGLYNDEDDNNLIRKNNGEILVVAECAKKMNITDINGNIPPSIRSARFLIPGVLLGKYKKDIPENVSQWLLQHTPDILLPFSNMAGGAPGE